MMYVAMYHHYCQIMEEHLYQLKAVTRDWNIDGISNTYISRIIHKQMAWPI